MESYSKRELSPKTWARTPDTPLPALTQSSLLHCAEDIVLNGPSDNVLKFGSKICYNRNEFQDNGLNEAEMDLCGVYKLYSKH